jgi:hypothetical protein
MKVFCFDCIPVVLQLLRDVGLLLRGLGPTGSLHCLLALIEIDGEIHWVGFVLFLDIDLLLDFRWWWWWRFDGVECLTLFPGPEVQDGLGGGSLLGGGNEFVVVVIGFVFLNDHWLGGFGWLERVIIRNIVVVFNLNHFHVAELHREVFDVFWKTGILIDLYGRNADLVWLDVSPVVLGLGLLLRLLEVVSRGRWTGGGGWGLHLLFLPSLGGFLVVLVVDVKLRLGLGELLHGGGLVDHVHVPLSLVVHLGLYIISLTGHVVLVVLDGLGYRLSHQGDFCQHLFGGPLDLFDLLGDMIIQLLPRDHTQSSGIYIQYKFYTC